MRRRSVVLKARNIFLALVAFLGRGGLFLVSLEGTANYSASALIEQKIAHDSRHFVQGFFIFGVFNYIA